VLPQLRAWVPTAQAAGIPQPGKALEAPAGTLLATRPAVGLGSGHCTTGGAAPRAGRLAALGTGAPGLQSHADHPRPRPHKKRCSPELARWGRRLGRSLSDSHQLNTGQPTVQAMTGPWCAQLASLALGGRWPAARPSSRWDANGRLGPGHRLSADSLAGRAGGGGWLSSRCPPWPIRTLNTAGFAALGHASRTLARSALLGAMRADWGDLARSAAGRAPMWMG